ncbi:MAG TPA: arginine--tRNA ligase [Solirubrobacteraceae bacterium]|nr:arginine--tRNA ligase [Solirubrobacteraceae bacterium]
MSSASLEDLRSAVTQAAVVLGSNGAAASNVKVERPKRDGQGDYSTNMAMLLAPALRKPPREIAEQVGVALSGVLEADLVRFEVAGPGFVNLFLSDDWYRRALRTVLDAGERFGAGGAPVSRRVLVEFVSANPTGPLVAASGRHAAYGDALSRVLEHHGHEVWREYYFNDAGSQIQRLGESVLARARGEDVPEGGYQGEYLNDVARRIPGVEAMSVDEAAAHAVELLLTEIKTTLERYGVHYDQYFSERTLHEGSPSYMDRALELVAQGGNSYESEGALWLRSTSFGDDKDRVLRRSDGAPTYLAADVAYLLQKRERGTELQLLPVGADHHGYVARMKAGWAALGGDPDTLEMPIIQFVHLVEGTERAAMSKRRGEFITLDDLLDEIGVDATRFWMLQRSHDRTLDLDLALAKQESPENPVYYVQYAHARIVSMIGRLSEDRVAAALDESADWDGDPLQAAERNLIKALVAFPDEIAEAVERRGPHRIAAYALELAQDFTAFYRDCKVVGAEPEATESFRIALSQAARQTIKLALWLLGVSAPDSM